MLKAPVYVYGLDRKDYTPPPDPAWKIWLRILLPYLFFGALALFFYIRTAGYGYSWLDDNFLILDNAAFNQKLSNLAHIFNSNYFGALYRPLLFASFIIDAQFSGIEPLAYHWANIIYFTCSILLIWHLLRRLAGNTPITFGLMLIYTVHPLFVPVASWIPGRNDSLLLLAWIPAFLFYLNYRESKRIIHLLLHGLFFGLSLLIKESAIVLPVLCLLYDLLHSDTESKSLLARIMDAAKKNGVPIILWSLLAAGFLFMRHQVLKNQPPNGDKVGIQEILFNLPTIPSLAGKAIIPVNLFVLGNYEWLSMGIGIFVILLLFILLNRKNTGIKKSEALFWTSWFLLILLPTMAASRANADIYFTYAEHRSFLPLLGMLMLIIRLAYGMGAPVRWTLPSALTILPLAFIYAALAWSYMPTYQGRTQYWGTAAQVYPDKAEMLHAYGKALYAESKMLPAEKAYKQAISLAPEQTEFYSDLAKVYLYGIQPPDNDKAINTLLIADSLHTQDASIYQNLTVAFDRKGMINQALISAEKSVYYAPNSIEMLNNLCLLYFKTGRYPEAEKTARHALSLQEMAYTPNTVLFDVLIVQRRYLEAAALIGRIQKLGVKIPEQTLQALAPYH
jgi:tetratricopeptide (TPR) repeat protein